MRSLALIVLVALSMALVESFPGLGTRDRQPAPYVNRLPPPKIRFRRSPEPEPQGYFRPYAGGDGLRAGYNQGLWHNDRSFGNANVGIDKYPGNNRHIGVNGGLGGGVHLGNTPGSMGTVTGNVQKNFNGPERRPSFGLGYEKKISEGKSGSLSVYTNVQTSPGQAPYYTTGIKGTF